jgi:hypothetical protein
MCFTFSKTYTKIEAGHLVGTAKEHSLHFATCPEMTVALASVCSFDGSPFKTCMSSLEVKSNQRKSPEAVQSAFTKPDSEWTVLETQLESQHPEGLLQTVIANGTQICVLTEALRHVFGGVHVNKCKPYQLEERFQTHTRTVLV